MPPELSDPFERDQADLAALADGSLPGSRRAEVEARVAASPELQAALDRQRLALDEIRGTEEDRAPDRLRAWLQEEAGRARGAPRRARRPWRVLAPLGAAAAAASIALVLVLTGGGVQAQQLAEAAARPPAQPAPTARGLRLPVRSDGIAFPNWEPTLGWRATGVRTDRVGGRRAVTVTYRRGAGTVAYAILARPPGDLPDGKGPYKALAYGGRPAVVWLRSGRTCLLLGDKRTSVDALRQLAATVRFY